MLCTGTGELSECDRLRFGKRSGFSRYRFSPDKFFFLNL